MKIPGKKKKKLPPTGPGGKALERLHQFEEERGLEPTEIEPQKKKQPSKAKKVPA